MRRKTLAWAMCVGLMTATCLSSAAFAEETSSAEETTVAGAEEETASDAEETTEAFDYSAGLEENGYFTGITALDYVTLPDYSSIELYESEVVPSDDAVQSELESVLADYATEKQVTDRAVEDGDSVNIDFVGTIDGEEFSGGSTEGAGTTVTIGVTNYIDDFLEQLIGHEPGETFDVEVTFPEDYGNEELNGKDAVFAVTINYISETIEAELTDEFVAENFPDYETAEGYTQYVYDALYQNNELNALWSWLMTNASYSEVPTAAADSVYDAQYQQLSLQCSMYGLDVPTYLSYYGMTEEDFYTQCEATAGQLLICQAIMEADGLEMNEEDMQAATGYDDLTDIVDFYGQGYVHNRSLANFLMTYLSDRVTLVEGEPETEAVTEIETTAESETEEESSTDAE